MEIAGIHSKRAYPEDAVNSNSNKKTLSIVAAVVAEKQFQATTLEIPEKRLPLCGQWNNELTQLQSHSISKLAL